MSQPCRTNSMNEASMQYEQAASPVSGPPAAHRRPSSTTDVLPAGEKEGSDGDQAEGDGGQSGDEQGAAGAEGGDEGAAESDADRRGQDEQRTAGREDLGQR